MWRDGESTLELISTCVLRNSVLLMQICYSWSRNCDFGAKTFIDVASEKQLDFKRVFEKFEASFE